MQTENTKINIKVEILTNDINTIKQYVRQITENHIKVISSFQNEGMLIFSI